MKSPSFRARLGLAASALALLAPVASHAALLARNLDANPATVEAYFDTVLNISWYAGAPFSGTLNDAKTWAANLSVGSANDWRLPSADPINGNNYSFAFSNNGSTDRGTAAAGVGWGTASELGHLYYVTLANEGFCLPDNLSPGTCAPNPLFSLSTQNQGPFSAWSTTAPYFTEDEDSFGYPLTFSFNGGIQLFQNEGVPPGIGWAVHAGDVGNAVGPGEVPEPGSLALALGAMVALVLGKRGRRAGRRPLH